MNTISMVGAIRDPKELKVGMKVRKHHIHLKESYTWEILSGPKPFREYTKSTFYGENLLNVLCIKVRNEHGTKSVEFLSDCGVIPYTGGEYNESNYLTKE